MPYRHAHYYLPLLFPLTFLAFWPGYFSDLRGATYSTHLHGVTASLWILLLALQSWSIHQRRRILHRSVGLWSFALFPLFTIGGLLVMHSMAGKFGTSSGGPFIALYGPRLGGSADALSTLGILYLFYMGLKCRRNVQLHARYMLTTVFFLFSPIATRLSLHLPAFAINGPEDMHRFAYNFHFWNVIAAMLALLLYFQAPKWGRPFLVVVSLIGMQSLLFETLGRSNAWEKAFTVFASVPPSGVVAIGLAVSLVALWTGWNRGRPVSRPVPAI